MYFDSENELFYQFLSSLGDYYRLNRHIDLSQFSDEIGDLESFWHKYNPRKNIERFGMSLTSLDGSTDGVPDLDSIAEYNKEHNVELNDMSFRTQTPTYKKLNSISSAIEPFEPYLGRSHLIKLKQGGFFPPHRDAYFSQDNSFRLFAPLTGCTDGMFVFLINGKREFFRPGDLYFINTRIEHSVFSFEDSAIMLILNIELSNSTVKLVTKNLVAT